MGFFNEIILPPKDKNINLPYNQMLSNERTHKINLENMFVLIFNFGLYKPFISFLQKSMIFISNSMVSLKIVNRDSLQRSNNLKLVSFQRADTAVIF